MMNDSERLRLLEKMEQDIEECKARLTKNAVVNMRQMQTTLSQVVDSESMDATLGNIKRGLDNMDANVKGMKTLHAIKFESRWLIFNELWDDMLSGLYQCRKLLDNLDNIQEDMEAL